MEAPKKISAIICTHNRCLNLKGAILSLQKQNFPFSDYEIIVVDNRSTDNTKAVVEEMNSQKGVQVGYFFEEKLGLSQSRNTGFANANGEIVAFIDDDAIADPAWLAHLTKVYKEERDTICVGGKVILKWEVSKPRWWDPSFNREFGVDHGDERKELKYPHFPYGTNISFKRSFFQQHGGFNVSLGRKGSKLLGWEETDVCLRIEKSGGRIFYEPNAIVHHIISFDRIKRSFIFKRSYWHGRSHAMLEQKHFGEDYVEKKTKNRWGKFFSLGFDGGNLVNIVSYHLGYQVQRVLIKLGKGGT